MAGSKRRSSRVLAGRKRSIYYDPSDDEFDGNSSDGAEEYQPKRRSSSQPEAGPSRPQQRPTKRRKVDRRTKPDTRAKEKRMQRFKIRPLGGKEKKKSRSSSQHNTTLARGFTGPSDGHRPDWTRVPAEIWRDIFLFASHPIHEQSNSAIINVKWLIRSARICRALAVPALEAYYQSPSLLINLSPHDLLVLVEKPQEELYMNYKTRVTSLELDAKQLTSGAKGRHPFHLDHLVHELPRLQDLQVVQSRHKPPYRSIKNHWGRYPAIDLLQALKWANIRLRSWRWSRDMIDMDRRLDPGTLLSTMQHSDVFSHLRRLVLCDFQASSVNEQVPSIDGGERHPPQLAAVISALPRLKDLTFISCDAVAEDFFRHISRDLERLEISNCLEVTSAMLADYLALGGSHLRELVLNHNASLSLGFLEQLSRSCPRLETLKVDLTYYSERITYNDAWALYDYVLAPDQVPTWPSTLRHLELVHMQKWEADAAQNLFRSLVENAKDLPDLRHLALQAHINIPWRDRAGFRDQWIERLQRVYLRRYNPPKPHLGSLKEFRIWKQIQGHGTGLQSSPVDPLTAIPFSGRRASHVRITPRKAPADVAYYSDAPSPTPQGRSARPRRSTRVAESQATSTAAEESSSDDESDNNADNWRTQPEIFIQGLCDVVDIRIDNQRPRETQYTEKNFLDSERSGDEDWQSGQELSDGDGYAW